MGPTSPDAGIAMYAEKLSRTAFASVFDTSMTSVFSPSRSAAVRSYRYGGHTRTPRSTPLHQSRADCPTAPRSMAWVPASCVNFAV